MDKDVKVSMSTVQKWMQDAAADAEAEAKKGTFDPKNVPAVIVACAIFGGLAEVARAIRDGAEALGVSIWQSSGK